MDESFFTPIVGKPYVPEDRHGPDTGPPSSLPGLCNQRAVLHKSDHLAVAVYGFACYSAGYKFTMRVEGRGFGRGRFHFLFDPSDSWADHGHTDDPNPYSTPDEQFRLGLEFSDGTSWENFVASDRGGPTVTTAGSSGSSIRCTQGFWVAALPPPGEFKIHALWPSVGMPECSATLSADALIAAATEDLLLIDWHK